MDPCIFCEIVAARSPASVVYDDARHMAFMDLRPVHRGHVLVIPKRHARLVEELTAHEVAGLMQSADRVYRALQASSLRAEGVTWLIADGPPDQEVPHVHVHLMPRSAGDGFGFRLPPGYGPSADRADLDAAAGEIRAAVGD